MLIKALCDYADEIEQRETDIKIADGFEKKGIHYRIMLTPDGDVDGIQDVCERTEVNQKNGKAKMVINPVDIILPKRTQKPGIDSNIIEHRPLYIFGLNAGKETFSSEDSTNKAKKSHKAFVEKNAEFFKDLDSEMCRAYYRFLKKWNPEDQMKNINLLNIIKKYKSSSFGFSLTGFRANLEDDERFKEKYKSWAASQDLEDTENMFGVCGIFGEQLKLARIHEKIKFPGGNTTGCVLVGMKEPAFESYGKKQSYNSNISEKAMLSYTKTLNTLLSDRKHYVVLDDMVMVYFAIKENDEQECSWLSACFGNLRGDEALQIEQGIHKSMQRLMDGKLADYSGFDLDETSTFYIAGLTPNSSRISQKFIYRDTFGNMMNHLLCHQKDLQISASDFRQISFYQIKKELVRPNTTTEKVPPSMTAGIITAALQGVAYPTELLETVIRRIRTDQDKENQHYIKMNPVRIGIIKACLNRKQKKEEIDMDLNMTGTIHPAYVCGEIFAIYEKIQNEASGGKLNRTIRDSYFSAACTRPASIFPKLSRLSMNHLRTIERDNKGSAVFYNKLLTDKTAELSDAYPALLDLDSQGRFIIGYYKQNKEFYTKKQVNEAQEESES